MGCQTSSQAQTPDGADPDQVKKLENINASLDKDNKKKQEKESEVRKILLLGSGESGKSTVFKQMIKLFGKGFNDVDRMNYKSAIVENIVEGIRKMIIGAQNEKLDLLEENVASAQYVLENFRKIQQLTPESAGHIKKCWSDPVIKQVFNNRGKIHVIDACAYFLDNIDAIAEAKYVPSDEDLLKVRVRTTGMIQEEFDLQGVKMRMMDVGGQKNERRKWIHCFEDVTSVFYIAAISEYDQMCFEDEETNRVMDSLKLFEETVNLHWFTKTSVILFLNKKDLFEQKFPKVPLKNYFPDFNGSTPEEAYPFFTELYRQRFKGGKDLYTHVTTATDSQNILHVLNDVRHIIVKSNFEGVGFF